jgi:gamma-butyrobetaine dioxygenase
MKLAAQQSPTGLSLVRDDRSLTPIHPLWLRERCREPDLLDARTQQRLFNPSDVDEALQVIDVAGGDEQGWRVVFSDGVRSVFQTADLLAELEPARDPFALPPRVAWDSGLSPLPRLAWSEDPLAILEPFFRYGFVILSGVPSEPGTVLQVARRFGFPRETNFGISFDVRSVPAAIDLAYTHVPLDPHTDNPYREPVPGIQLLHCLENRTSGGLSTLVDGLAVSEALRASDPAAFDLLSTVPVGFRFTDPTTELVDQTTIIELGCSGEIIGLRYSPRLDRVPFMAPDALTAFYGARRALDRLLRSAAYEVRFLLDDGDLVMFDNRRLLHGRTGFDPREGNRHLQGCYIDVDGPRSLYRVLRRS